MNLKINFFAYPDFLNMLNQAPLYQDSANAVLVGTSPFTGANYTIASITKNQIRGYQIASNIADCTTGSDWLADNDMPAAMELALLLLQNCLLKNGCRPETIHAFSLSQAEIEQATLVFHVAFPSSEEAIQAKMATYRHAEAIHNYRLREKPLAKDPVRWQGSSHHGFWTLENSGFCLRVSTKTRDRQPPDSRVEVANLTALNETSRYLTYELTLLEPWLIKAKLQTPSAWIKAGNTAYEKAWALIERALWSDFKFRRRLPRPDDKPSNRLVDRDLSDWYFLGHNVREHPVVQEHADSNPNPNSGSGSDSGSDSGSNLNLNPNPQAYFLKANQRIRKLLHIDYRIPWKIAQNYIAHDIKRYLDVSDPSRLQLPKTLTQHRFGPETAPRFIKALKDAIIKQKKERQPQQMTRSDSNSNFETPGSVAEKPAEPLSQSKLKSKSKPKLNPKSKSKSKSKSKIKRNH